MLFAFTLLVDFLAMAATLWLAFYLFGRGFPSRIVLRAVVVLLALAGFFFSAYYNLFHQIIGSAAWRSVLLLTGMVTWYSLTYKLLPDSSQIRLRWLRIGIYTLTIMTAILLLVTPNAFVGEQGNRLYVARMGGAPPYILYGLSQFVIAISLLYNLLSGNKIGLTPQGRFFLLASIFPIAAVVYGVLALGIAPPLPRLVQDLLIFSGVFLMGVSVARHQSLVQRRTTLEEFLLSGLAMFMLVGLYAYLGWIFGIEPGAIAGLTVFTIATHSSYDLVREFLERRRNRQESALRLQIRQLESGHIDEERLQHLLQKGLNLLCESLNASGGFIAVRRDQTFAVTASWKAIPCGNEISAGALICDDVSKLAPGQLQDITWIAPAFEADRQVAVVGLAQPRKKPYYSAEDLDLLAEVADRIGGMISLSKRQPAKAVMIRQLFDEYHLEESELRSRANEMLASIAATPDPEFIKMVEEGLRNLSDYIALGQLPLADWAAVGGNSHIERGRELHQALTSAISTLRPPGQRPTEPIPRVWYNYIVLHDAYIEGVPNREIMARLFISEGTFNRTRRNALRGLSRHLFEMTSYSDHLPRQKSTL
jgi:GAF domain-containing protein